MGFKDVVIDILERDPTLASKKDFGGTTPLHVATFFKDVEISRILIEHGNSPAYLAHTPSLTYSLRCYII